MLRAKPRVLIDATAVPSDRGGVGRYVDSLVSALSDGGGELGVACRPRDAELYGQLAPAARVLPTAESTATRTARLTWEQTTLPMLVRRLGVDVVHSPHYTLPLANPAASVVTLHDATFFTDSALHAGFLGGATLVAYPSLGEGFGLPVLEAMACAAAVVTTRRLSLPEVGADAVDYCGVGAGDVAAALTALLDDPSRRAALSAAAQRRAKEFSWQASAKRHREVYDRAWRGQGGRRRAAVCTISG